ncbi:MAG: chemotaxis protein CheC [Anaerovoracaceae bacterium]|jgi:chemotaxis protein CheC
MKINDLEYDILKEIFNIGVGRAASMLSEIVDKKILLDVPRIELFYQKDQDLNLNSLPNILEGTLLISSIKFGDKLTGKANLIFPAIKTRELINICLNKDEKCNCSDVNFTDVDFDIIKEIGNIVLNSIIGEIGNHLNTDLIYSIPEVKVFNTIDLKKDIESKPYTYILILYITFIIDGIKIEGSIIIEFTLESLNTLLSKINQIGDELNE